ncbi:TIGR00266 family protein [Miltoncostaea oceani]|uniref:TIGR00266 family protein n=1 Tax=Miltoncostaea oceani TaxID=2843216 RepID=UPI001C3DBADD|nr:TIGR00266 family protein [Miltoncostaea oceani]
MDIAIRHAPSFAVARCTLGGGEVVRAESGAMMSTSEGVDIQAAMQGGLMKSLKRGVLGGESFFITTYTAPPAGGWVDVAANLPGDLAEVEVGATPFFIQRGSYLASESGVEIDTKWGGFKNLFGGEGGFLVRASGRGTVLLSCYGALDRIRLAEGETVVVDSGHMVAFEEGVTFDLRRAAGGRTVQTLKSGEGFVFDFRGPGEVMVQSRNPSALIAWLTTVLPFSRS